MAKFAKITSLFSFNSSKSEKYSSSKIGSFLEAIWPIHNHELKKFLYITLLMFCILCIQNLIRALKDSIVNTMIGAETISFLKFYGVMPSAFLIAILYVKLVNTMRGEYIFYLIMSSFLGFFALFAFYIFPNHNSLHLSPETVSNLILSYPNLKWFILLLSNWSFSLFYVIAELWPNAMFALLFWQFVNKVTDVEESKRFYPLFGLLGQTGLYLSGTFLENLDKLNLYIQDYFGMNSNKDTVSIQIVLSIVTMFGILGLFTFWKLNHRILDISKRESVKFTSKKKNIGLLDSIKMVLSSKYIMLIAILLFSYGVAINLVEGPWKASAAALYKTPTEFAAFVGGYLKYTGIFTIIFVIVGSNVVRKLGWFAAAIITPIMVFTTGMAFFLVANFYSIREFLIGIFLSIDPTLIAINIGAIQNVLSKSTKYTLFDSTKEMSYVPLEEDLKAKGKAAADMIGTKLGKSTGALVQSSVFILIPTATYQSISIYLMSIFTLVCLVWIWGTVELSKEYNLAVENNNKSEK